MIISRTPFRVSFFGGGTDLPEFYGSNRGATLLTSIDKYSYITIHRLGPFFKYRFRASYARTELVQQPDEFDHPLIRECLLHLGIEEGLEITHVSDLPGRTGLGSSSSFTVGLLQALHAFLSDEVSAEDLARESIYIERTRVKDPGGHQDQYAAAYGGLVRLDFAGEQDVRVRRLTLPHARMRDLEQHLMLFYTGMEQSAEDVMHAQRSRIQKNTSMLLEMLDMVDEAERILESQSEPLQQFGDLLHETWQRKRGLSPGISNSVVDEAYAAAREAGARGGKLLGAGGRGFLLVFADRPYQTAVRERLQQLREVRLGFSPQGSEIIFRTPEE